MTDLLGEITRACRLPPVRLPRRASNELRFVLREGEDMPRVAAQLAALDCDLAVFFATDERRLEAGAFKTHLFLSAPGGEIIMLEQALITPGRPFEYHSVRAAFPAAAWYEQEIYELFGLAPLNLPLPQWPQRIKEGPYRPDFHPLLRDQSMEELVAGVRREPLTEVERSVAAPRGLVRTVAGPIHAGVKEAGELEFWVAGETIEALEVYPGRKHRGIEKLFESAPWDEGARVAEVIDGPTCVAHTLAYSMAVESIAGLAPSAEAQTWRAILLELERLTSHIGNCATLTGDLRMEAAASAMTSLRERLRAVSQRLTGSRWLRDTIWPGGVYVAGGMPPDRFAAAVTRIVDEFTPKALAILQSPACRDRLIGCGLLTTDEARGLGVMGLPRRVAGYMERDWRLRHPFGPYEREDIREEIRATVAEGQPRSEDGQLRPRGAALRPRDLTGDNLAKMALRVAEVETSARIIERLAAELDGTAGSGAAGLQDLPGKTDRHSLADDDAYELGFGAVEGARGPVGCCVMRGPGRLLYRCKPFGASPGLLRAFSAAAAVRSGPNQTLLGDILADAPLDNVAMNASLAECAG